MNSGRGLFNCTVLEFYLMFLRQWVCDYLSEEQAASILKLSAFKPSNYKAPRHRMYLCYLGTPYETLRNMQIIGQDMQQLAQDSNRVPRRI
jgi:hypothetical protein